MAYRRSHDESPEGSRWRLSHQSLLLECGVPTEVAQSDRRWVYVLLHGDDAFGTGWNPSWISTAQAWKLLKALSEELDSETGFDLIRLLKRRAESSVG